MSKPRSVLVVDDNADYCEIVAAILSGEGYSVDTCSAASEAIALAASRSYAAILLEPSPSASVQPVLGYLAGFRADALPHVVVTTTESDRDVLEGFERYGVFRVLHKPLSRKTLTAAVTECCQAVR